MKTFLLILVLSSSAFAQNQAGFSGAGCGPNENQFDVKVDKKQHPQGQPDPGKALVYFLEEDLAPPDIGGKPVFRAGLDGTWLGAVHSNSYFFVSVEPGEHRVCAGPQPMGKSDADLAGAASLTAEAGKVYYFRLRYFEKNRAKFELLDSPEGQLQISTGKFGLSTFNKKK